MFIIHFPDPERSSEHLHRYCLTERRAFTVFSSFIAVVKRSEMGKSVVVLLWLLVILETASAQAEKAERALPNWLTGIIAVAVFLFLVFIAFLVNKAWCETRSDSQEVKTEVTSNEYSMSNGTNLDSVRSSEHHEAYENVIIHKTEEKVTVM
ncbi:PDZK1-interacting protein 1 [Astyanax mexicanus]|uniref:PDZK1-interacting protein 1 n=1 Tax=Astyanax mexicanus TaxID=7994 RepID=UPI0020CB3CA3|nr:PDZK1-interacting protein 1 [Astyanax mexicanus]